jgi:hypothetical protein
VPTNHSSRPSSGAPRYVSGTWCGGPSPTWMSASQSRPRGRIVERYPPAPQLGRLAHDTSTCGQPRGRSSSFVGRVAGVGSPCATCWWRRAHSVRPTPEAGSCRSSRRGRVSTMSLARNSAPLMLMRSAVSRQVDALNADREILTRSQPSATVTSCPTSARSSNVSVASRHGLHGLFGTPSHDGTSSATTRVR